MSQYTDFPINFIKRTQKNLENYKGEFETTNLINNCLGLIIIPKQKLNEHLPKYIFDDENNDYGITKKNIEFENKDDFSLSKILGHIRNGLSHGRIEQKTENGQIVGLRIHDKYNGNDEETFAIEFSIDEFKKFAIAVSNAFAR
jgi:uncharacterized protein YxjI